MSSEAQAISEASKPHPNWHPAALWRRLAGEPELVSAELRAWQQRLARGILRAAAIVGLLAAAAGSYNAVVDGVTWQIPIYVSVYLIALLLAFLRGVPYELQAGLLVGLLYGLGVLDFFEDGMSGSGRIFLICAAAMAVLLFGRRSTIVVVPVAGLTMGIFGWAYTSGRIVVPIELLANSLNPSAWVSGTVAFLMVITLLVLSQNFLIPGLADALTRSKRLAGELEAKVEEARVAKAMAQEANRLKSEFVATMSHELRTPLNAIIGFTEIMLAGMGGIQLDERTRHMSERVHANSLELLTLINDLLDLARIESNRVDLVNKPFAPADLLRETHNQMASLAQQKNLHFDLAVESDLPQQVTGDPAQVRRVVNNLLSNAFKFTREGHVKLAASPAKDNCWTIAVSDTGIGIPPHALEYIFDPFRQVDGSYQRAYGGTGLGLAITRELVRAMGGTVQVESALGRGSTFTVTLPVQASGDRPPDAPPATESHPAPGVAVKGGEVESSVAQKA